MNKLMQLERITEGARGRKAFSRWVIFVILRPNVKIAILTPF